MNKLTMIARIKQVEEEIFFWKKAHLNLQSNYIKFKEKVYKELEELQKGLKE